MLPQALRFAPQAAADTFYHRHIAPGLIAATLLDPGSSNNAGILT
jgi:hypothetical protein